MGTVTLVRSAIRELLSGADGPRWPEPSWSTGWPATAWRCAARWM